MKLYYKKNGGLTSKSKLGLQAALKRGTYKKYFKNPSHVCRQNNILIPINKSDFYTRINELKHNYNPRKQNWDDSVPAVTTHITERGFSYKGSFSGYSGSYSQVNLQSFCRLSSDNKKAYALIDGKKYIFNAGSGYILDVDTNGLRLLKISTGDDFHLDTSDFFSGFIKSRTELLKNAKTRRETRKQLRLQKKKIDGIWVSFNDSISAGNCAVGTKNYINRNNLNIKKHYKAKDLPGALDNNLVKIVIAVASRRQTQEIKSGFCKI